MSHSFLPLSVQLASQLLETPGRLNLRLGLLLGLASREELAKIYSETLALPAPPFLDNQDIENFLTSKDTDSTLLLARSLAATGYVQLLLQLFQQHSDPTILLQAAIVSSLFHSQWDVLGWVLSWAKDRGRLPALEFFLRETWRSWYRATGDNLEKLRQLDLQWPHETQYDMMDYKPQRTAYLEYLLGLDRDPIPDLDHKLYELLVLFDDALEFALNSPNPSLLERVQIYLHYWAVLLSHAQELHPYHLGRQQLLKVLVDNRTDLIGLIHSTLKGQPEIESFVWTTAVTGGLELKLVPRRLLVKLLNWGLDPDILLLVSAYQGLLKNVKLAVKAGAVEIPQAIARAAQQPKVLAYLQKL